eukprot:Nk52_evm1s1742 gene=Nk52_evmTU1s1742
MIDDEDENFSEWINNWKIPSRLISLYWEGKLTNQSAAPAHACYVRQPTESGSLLVSDSSSNSSSVSTGSCGSEYASSVRSED